MSRQQIKPFAAPHFMHLVQLSKVLVPLLTWFLSLLMGVCWVLIITPTAAMAQVPNSAPTKTLDLTDLMKALANNKGGRANFIERKYIANISSTVESSGELVFLPPHRLERRTLKPKEESIVLDQDSLTWTRGKTQRIIALNDYPELSVLVTSIRSTLLGDQKSLQQHYKITLEGTLQEWRLGLTPKQSRAAAKVQHIQIMGSQEHASKIDFALADGDYSTMFVSKPISP
jgi:outer membrane lipoprotein-sorting protein